MKNHNIGLWSLVAGFLALSLWPFVGFPITDLDVTHWVGVALDVAGSGFFLTSIHDQAHGPLLSWLTAPALWLFGPSFVVFNVANAVLASAAIGFMIWFSYRLLGSPILTGLSTLIFATNLMIVYQARTPMYDLPATVFYFIAAGCYLLYLEKNRTIYVGIAALAAAVGSLSRFSIVLGLMMVFVTLTHWIYRRSMGMWIRNCLIIVSAIALINIPWVAGQTMVHGDAFLNTFFTDNFSRYLADPNPGVPVSRDYFAFFLTVLWGLSPFTSVLLTGIWQKPLLRSIIQHKAYLAIVAGFIPCLLIFSFSGHIKLDRYITYVFPFLSIFCAIFLEAICNEKSYRKIFTIVNVVFLAFLMASLAFFVLRFSAEFKEAGVLVILAVGSIIFNIAALTVSVWVWPSGVKIHPYRLGWVLMASYAVLVTGISVFYSDLSFFEPIHQKMEALLTNAYD